MIYAPSSCFSFSTFYINSNFIGPLYATAVNKIVTKIKSNGLEEQVPNGWDVYAIKIRSDGLEVRICG